MRAVKPRWERTSEHDSRVPTSSLDRGSRIVCSVATIGGMQIHLRVISTFIQLPGLREVKLWPLGNPSSPPRFQEVQAHQPPASKEFEVPHGWSEALNLPFGKNLHLLQTTSRVSNQVQPNQYTKDQDCDFQLFQSKFDGKDSRHHGKLSVNSVTRQLCY